MTEGITLIGNIINNIREAILGKTKEGAAANRDSANLMSLITGANHNKLDSTIAKEARKSIAQFPMIVADSIPIEHIMKLSKKLENAISNLLLLCIQNGNDLIDLSDPQAKSNFIKRFTNPDADNFNIPGVRAVLGKEGYEIGNFKEIAKYSLDIANKPFSDSFDLTVLGFPYISLKSEPEDDDPEDMIEAALGGVTPVSRPHGKIIEPYSEYGEESVVIKDSNLAGSTPLAAGSGSDDKVNKEKVKSEKEEKYSKNVQIEKKMDSLAPTIISADVLICDKTGRVLSETTKIAFGVKTVSHIVNSAEMVEAIKETFSESSLLIRLIRWRVGEISFIKDVILNMKEIKRSVKAQTGRSGATGPKAIFANLRFKVQNAIAANAATTKAGRMLPTAILVVTPDEVESVYRSCGKNIFKNIRDARELCSKLALFAIVVVEPPNDIFHVFYDDGSTIFSTHSFKDDDKKNDDQVVKAIFGALKR
jgi:hypothetical protein